MPDKFREKLGGKLKTIYKSVKIDAKEITGK